MSQALSLLFMPVFPVCSAHSKCSVNSLNEHFMKRIQHNARQRVNIHKCQFL